jgi:hypothetical protein
MSFSKVAKRGCTPTESQPDTKAMIAMQNFMQTFFQTQWQGLPTRKAKIVLYMH